jgi:hypothetical protein
VLARSPRNSAIFEPGDPLGISTLVEIIHFISKYKQVNLLVGLGFKRLLESSIIATIGAGKEGG